MKLTNKQKMEIDYLKTWTKFWTQKEVSNSDIEDFINATVLGKGKSGKYSTNPLINAQQRMGITLTMWKEDLGILITKQELLDEASCEYEKKLILSL